MPPPAREEIVNAWVGRLGAISYPQAPAYPGAPQRRAIDYDSARGFLETAIREAFTRGAAYQLEIGAIPAILLVPAEAWEETNRLPHHELASQLAAQITAALRTAAGAPDVRP